MAVEKKRPRGLKGSAKAKANKKSKVDETPSEIPENAQTVVIDKVVEEGDEVGEAAALYESAIEKLETDAAAALPLLRGTIHESDRILRNHESSTPLPALFYFTYGAALYELGRLTEDEEFEPYLDAAQERLNTGLELNDATMEDKIRLALAKIWLAQAASAISQGDEQVDTIPALSTQALATLDSVIAKGDVPAKTMIELADIVQNHGDLYEDFTSREVFRVWAEDALNKVLEKEPENASALSELGLCQLSLANYHLDHEEEEDDEEEEEEEEAKTVLTQGEQKAYDAILNSKGYFETAKDLLVKSNQVSPQILSDLAETLLNQANLVLKEEEQLEIYHRVVENIKEANALIAEKNLDFILPEALTSFLEEFE
ncbi:nuclear pore complex subunit Nro1-domain-containing protein [Mucor mucedo]|uniref:nuclear pore complex subunit Nro1-domain-containing protein n=1 Tax=Mucor mucedo TaxID=29922 RepID=UPI002220499D|nr:nuclear pore complex subunit Nro1-domain-containing protein [Mucor mucedo]KAI7888089.1 nuclear pore complex subunit Nro1-domain-containing protein [Mucor mucedo]